MYALVDGNNFYCSAERAMRPSLQGRPLIVLSNNDGCAIARSNEAKDLGIKMGAPWFEIRHLENSAGLVALSANFPLYADISDRMMTLAAGLGPTQELYSIDESFVGLHGVRGDLIRRSRIIRQRILQWTGIPCCVGIGSSKTRAKLANAIAKSAERKPGSYPEELAQVCNLEALPASDQDAIFAATDVTEVWGVGRRIGAQLHDAGVNTVLDLIRLDPAMVKKRWSVVLERTVRELQGVSCIELDDAPGPKQQIAVTRSFGKTVNTVGPLVEAVSEFASRAGEKLRKQWCQTSQMLVFMHTSPFRQGPQLSRSVTVNLRRPTADSRQLADAAAQAVAKMYRPGYAFAKAGVMLMELLPANVQQGELDLEPEAEGQRDRSKLMVAMDAINGRFGRGTVHVGSTGGARAAKAWGMKQERRTPQYTTCWDDLPIARA